MPENIPLDLGAILHSMGILFRTTQRPADAESAYRKALELRRRLVKEHPKVAEYQNGLSQTLTSLANLLAEAANPDPRTGFTR